MTLKTRPRRASSRKKSSNDDGKDKSIAAAMAAARASRGRYKTHQMVSIVVLAVLVALMCFNVLRYWGNLTESRLSAQQRQNVSNQGRRLSTRDDGKVFTVKVVNEFIHDPGAFTQGLEYFGNNLMLESNGMYHESNIRLFNISTGEKTREKKNTRTDFGEGITAFQNTLYQELWRTNRVILYDQSTFAKMSERSSPMTDGWGLTNDGEQLIGSDSTSFLYFMDSELALKQKLQVTYLDEPVVWLNELEYIDGQVWANIWQRDCIARIDPATGKVSSWVVLSDLHRSLRNRNLPQHFRMDVLNGIAWDSEQNRIFVTGKRWPRMFEIELVEMSISSTDVKKTCMVPENSRI